MIGQIASSGRFCQVASSSATASLTLLIRSGETSTSYMAARWERMSRTLMPRAYNEGICSLNPASRLACLGTSLGVKEPLRSRGTATVTAPASVSTVFGEVPLRLLPDPRPAGSCFS